ncbi:hypothetical protein E2C01_076515 [Portunus trituberculatus]|uniref:Uncharacterized protein n=1 Tax=Portunus trituberculatus TaxID=210409 RepID=A0A5B7IJY3_PORTR|nr:hypothetical protein [Portunus trituberculatus]
MRHLATPVTRKEETVHRVMLSVLLSSDIEDSDENEDSDIFIETGESEDSSSDSDSDLGHRDQPSQQHLLTSCTPFKQCAGVCHPWLPLQDCACRPSHVNSITNEMPDSNYYRNLQYL